MACNEVPRKTSAMGAGQAAARARGRKGGMPFALKGQERADAMLLIESGRDTQYIMQKFKVSRSTVDRNWKL
jgi:DNA invertase Pin-like site-specific DNA recombinase